MATQVQWRGGSTAEHATFTGAAREVTVDTQKQTLVVHDGSTAGGTPLQKQYPPLGSAAAPTFTFSGDTNTGIYSPGADQVAVATNGTGRLFVASDGKIGIGGTPSNPLDVFGSATLGIRYKSSGSYAGILADNSSGTGGGYFGAYQNGTQKAIFGVTAAFIGDTSGDAGIFAETGQGIRFFTNGSAAEKVRVDVSGRLLVGTSSSSSDSVIVAQGYAGVSAGAGEISITRGGTPSTADQALGTIKFQNNNNNTGAQIDAVSEGSWTAGSNHRSRLTFSTTADGVSSPTERLRIDSSGRLFVGTSTSTNYYGATAKSYITDQGGANLPLALETFRNDSAGAYLILSHSRSGTAGNYTILQSDDGLGLISFNGSDGTDLVSVGATIKAEVDGTPGADDMPGRLVFSTTADGASAPTERMRIDQNGLIKTYSTGNGHTVNVSDGAGTSTFLYAGNRSSTDVQGSGATTVYYVYSNGTVQNATGTYTTISDAKLKENIVDASSQWNDLKAIQIRNWNFKAETGHETHRQIGPIAQELEEVCPGLVFETPDRDADGNETGEVTKGVNQSVLYMKAVKALQEAIAKIETLEGMVAVNNITIDEQQHQLSTLAARLTALESA
jgi:hypothetical protein